MRNGKWQAWRASPLALCIVAAGFSGGCARSLAVVQDQRINTAPHVDRAEDKRTGEPLELTIVCVYPGDAEKPGNELLAPTSNITSRDWYERRPTSEGGGSGRFALPASQIFLFTNDTNTYGRVIGKALRGAALDGDGAIVKSGIQFDGGWGGGQLHDRASVIYVFARFTDKNGEVLKTPPAKFHPPGAYSEELEIRVGVDADKALRGDLAGAQYVKVLSPRKMHKSDSN